MGLPATTPSAESAAITARLPLRGWALELARHWNGGSYSLFVLHGNIFDLFPLPNGDQFEYVPLKTFLSRRLFPERACLMFYDISGGLTFGSAEMQKKFFQWLEIFDSVENTNFSQQGPPKSFLALAPLLTRFFLKVAEGDRQWQGGEVTQYDKLKADAAKSGLEIPRFVKDVLAKALK